MKAYKPKTKTWVPAQSVSEGEVFHTGGSLIQIHGEKELDFDEPDNILIPEEKLPTQSTKEEVGTQNNVSPSDVVCHTPYKDGFNAGARAVLQRVRETLPNKNGAMIPEWQLKDLLDSLDKEI